MCVRERVRVGPVRKHNRRVLVDFSFLCLLKSYLNDRVLNKLYSNRRVLCIKQYPDERVYKQKLTETDTEQGGGEKLKEGKKRRQGKTTEKK